MLVCVLALASLQGLWERVYTVIGYVLGMHHQPKMVEDDEEDAQH